MPGGIGLSVTSILTLVERNNMFLMDVVNFIQYISTTNYVLHRLIPGRRSQQ